MWHGLIRAMRTRHVVLAIDVRVSSLAFCALMALLALVHPGNASFGIQGGWGARQGRTIRHRRFPLTSWGPNFFSLSLHRPNGADERQRAMNLRLLISVLLVVLSPAAWARPGYKKCDYRARNFDTVSSIYNLTVYPNQVPIIFGGAGNVPEHLFSHDVVGRVYPVGNFQGFEDSIEYFFALAPLPQGNVRSAAITSYKITAFSSGCPGVAASVVYLYSSVVDPSSPENGKPLAPLKQVSSLQELPLFFTL